MKYRNAKRIKHIAIITALMVTWVLNSSLTELYPEPLYYTVYESENVVIKYSREVYFDLYGEMEEINDQVYKRWEGIDDIGFTWSKKNYLDSRKPLKKEIKNKMKRILNQIN